MTHRDYDNALLTQVRGAARTVLSMAETFTFSRLEASLPVEELQKVQKVILTGCGDSYCIGLAARPCFETEGAYPAFQVEAIRNIEAARYYHTYCGWGEKKAEDHLICAVSITGSPVRPREALARIDRLGGLSLAFTDNENSLFAKQAKYAVRINVPQDHYKPGVTDEECPGMTSYIAGCYAVMMFGLYLCVCKGSLTRQQAEERRQAAVDYARAFTDQVIDGLEEKAFRFATKLQQDGFDCMDFIAEDQEFATAFFASAKMVESFGAVTTHDDAEDWCHINYFNRNPARIATFMVANPSSPSFSRDQETAACAVAIKRPLAIVCEDTATHLPEQAWIFQTPTPKYRWINALLQHIPMDFVAAYLGIFRRQQPVGISSELHERDAECARFKKSQQVFVEEL